LRAISCQAEKQPERKDTHRKPPRVLGAAGVAEVTISTLYQFVDLFFQFWI